MRPFTYHNHTVFCDGKSTVEEMVLSAIAHGCDAIGFSSHSFVAPDPDYCMHPEKIAEYCAEVRATAEKYKDKIKVYLGIEQDIESDAALYEGEYDYKIGSVHSVNKNGVFYSIDASEAQFLRVVEAYEGDAYALAEDYFAALTKVCELRDCEIVGHIDLLTKFNEGGKHFDEKNERYVSAAERAIKKLAAEGKIFEINTGAMSRGYRKTPYPAKHLLKIVRREGGRITYSSDCHAAENILSGYEDAVRLARECGFEGFMKLTDNGFSLVSFDEIP